MSDHLVEDRGSATLRKTFMVSIWLGPVEALWLHCVIVPFSGTV